MGLNENLVNILMQLGIDANSLSENEQRYISQIFRVYERHLKLNEELISKLEKNKVNKSIIVNESDFSRQAIYINPTLMIFVEWCERQFEINSVRIMPENAVSKDKYDRLKKENSLLLLNIIDDSIKDSEIERLAKENNLLRKRMENLVNRFEEKNKELIRFMKSNKN